MSCSTPFHKQTAPNKQAGQVVFSPMAPNTKPELYLSDYIERKTDEPKRITFDEWYVSMFGSGNWYSPDVVGVFKIIWNDALTKGKL